MCRESTPLLGLIYQLICSVKQGKRRGRWAAVLGHRLWASHNLTVARDSAVKLLTVIYDVYPLPLRSVLREAPVGDKYLTCPVDTRPWENTSFSRVLRNGPN